MGQLVEEIEKRRSIVAFSDEPVPEAIRQRIFEAARWAPSSYNEQPWRFIIADKHADPAQHEKMTDILYEVNQVWASKAPLLVLPVARKSFTQNGMPNRFNLYDTGQAVAQMSIQVIHEGLFMHQMGGYSPEKARTTFNIPEDYEPSAVIAIGYKGDTESLPEKLKAKELKARKRMPLDELVISGTF